MKDAMYEKSISKWTELSFEAPINQTTGRRYHPQTLARVARGEVINVQLRSWLEAKGICHAKTKKRKSGSSGNTTRTRANEKSVQHDSGKITELSEIAKAIRQEAYTYPANPSDDKRD
jgi:hypothetical protein|tara:strand:+ start:186 stop:539 length:354 start_codon:yes stop_codon:yes gene_type:complete